MEGNNIPPGAGDAATRRSERPLKEDLTSAYMDMCIWCWTPAAWSTAVTTQSKEQAALVSEPSSTPTSRSHALPMQLHRLPIASLMNIADSLAMLHQVGLQELPNVEELSDNIKGCLAVARGKELQDGLTTTYMGMCEWSWTPTKWREAATCDRSHCALAALSPSEASAKMADSFSQHIAWQAGNAVPNDDELAKTKRNLSKMLRRMEKVNESRDPRRKQLGPTRERLKIWLDSVASAGDDLRRLESCGDLPRLLGGGHHALFQWSAAGHGATMPKPGPDLRETLPVELRSLARRRLKGVSLGLSVLFEAGLTEVASVQELFDKMATSLVPDQVVDEQNTWFMIRASVPGRTQAEQSAVGAKMESVRRARAMYGNLPKMLEWSSDPALEWFDKRFGQKPTPRTKTGGDEVLFRKSQDGLVKQGQFNFQPDNRTGGGSRDIPPKKAKSGKPAVVMLHVGGFGCGVGMAAWTQIFAEHSIGSDGRTSAATNIGTAVHFAEARSGRQVPRAVFVDHDPQGISSAHKSGFFVPTDIIAGKGSLNGNWAEGYKSKSLRDEALESLRLQLEKCDTRATVITTNSFYGGTGGGLSRSIWEGAADFGRGHDPSKRWWSFGLVPPVGGQDNNATNNVTNNVTNSLSRSRVNAMLTADFAIKRLALNTYFDLDGLHRFATSRRFGLGLREPSAEDYQGLIAKVLAGCTRPLRLDVAEPASQGITRTVTPFDVVNNLVPYPRINSVVPSYFVARAGAMADFDTDDSEDLVSRCLGQGRLSSASGKDDKSIASALFCRGMPQSTAMDGTLDMKLSCAYTPVDWSPGNFLVGTNYSGGASKNPMQEVVGLQANSSVVSYFQSWSSAYTSLDQAEHEAIHSSYAQHGVEADTFTSSCDFLLEMERTYEEAMKPTADREGDV